MIKIGNVELGDTPKTALALCDEKNADFVREAKSQGIDLLETRIDQFRNVNNKNYVIKAIEQLKGNGLPIIATIRSKKEGGNYIPDTKRLELFNAVIPLVDSIDIELSSKQILNKVVKRAHECEKTVIGSYHNFAGTPTNRILEEIIKEIKAHGMDIIKIASLAKNEEDVIRLMKITLNHRDKNIITISMGSIGLISRVFFPFLGSLITYGCIDIASAPGQLPINILLEELRKFYPKFNESLIKRLKLMENI